MELLSIRPCSTGEGLFTEKPIEKGETIYCGKFDFFALSDAFLKKACQSCCRLLSESKSCCPKCKVIHYCSTNRLNSDSNLHKLECLVAQKSPRCPTQSQRILLRALQQKPLPSVRIEMDNVDPEILGYYIHGIGIVKNMLSDNELPFSLRQLLKLQCMLKFACVELEFQNERIGIAYSSLLSKVNHSCLPNSIYTSSGAEFSLISVRCLERNEEVTISYTGAEIGRNESKQDLMKNFGFSCSCQVCKK